MAFHNCIMFKDGLQLQTCSRRASVVVFISLSFANGEIYAGQALDVTRRYVQHRKVHGDIEKISFRRVAKDKLNNEERALIRTLEQNGHRLRNITFTSIPKGESDFDLSCLMSEFIHG
jgi:hypothetical protein